jgi:PPOX class probable F420-dependent enzyme
MSTHNARTDYASIEDPEILHFLTTTYDTGQLAYTRKDGRPVISPIWFVVDGGDIVFATSRHSVKAKAFQRDGRVVFNFDKVAGPMAFVNVEGTVTEAPDDFDRILPLIAERYGRYGNADDILAATRSIPGETIYRIRPITVQAKLDGGKFFNVP